MTSSELFDAFRSRLSSDASFSGGALRIDTSLGRLYVSDYKEKITLELAISPEDFGFDFGQCTRFDVIVNEYADKASLVCRELKPLYPSLCIWLAEFEDILVQWEGLPENLDELEEKIELVMEAVAKGRELMWRVIHA